MKGGPATGPSPVDRGKTGSKHHVIVDAHSIPLATITTGGNRNDVAQLIPLIEAILPIRDDIHDAFLTLGCAIICWRRLRNHAICQESLACAAPSARCARRGHGKLRHYPGTVG